MNNHRLKFRAWNKETKILYLSPDEKQHLGSWFDAHLPGAIANIDNIEITQCTGLEDKNGILIYEGDIVEQEGDDEPFVVKYGCQEVHAFEIMGFNLCTYSEYGENGLMNPKRLSNEIKIIGNIYENPELMDG